MFFIGLNWLNDQVIEFYLQMVAKRKTIFQHLMMNTVPFQYSIIFKDTRHQATSTNNFVRFALRVRPVYVCPSDMTVSSPIDPRSNCTSAKQIMLELLFFFAGDKLVKFLSRLLVYSLFEWFETIISILRSCCRLYLGAPRDQFSFLNYTFFMRFN